VSKYTEHVEKWKTCNRCELCNGRKQVVLVRGQLPCDVLFIGEAPGESENVLGKPFCGPAGQLLDRIVAAGIGQDAVRHAYTNLVACIPREPVGDATGGPTTYVGKAAEPPDKAIEACDPRLREIVTIARPKLIVCVGKLASKWVPRMELGRKIPMIDMVHPAAIMRAATAQQGLVIQKAVVTLATALEDYVLK
jgi:uracil-DNA glycosylase family 4